MAKLETLRAEKTIGKALEAVVTLYIGETEKNLTSHYAEALPELFNVSEVDLVPVTDDSSSRLSVERLPAHQMRPLLALYRGRRPE